ncbi:MAG: NTP transferase domain-containing protein [Desulfobaccales bacterium]|nr:NTP transferase domain-containing protein [Desulfobaccales bacterium]
MTGWAPKGIGAIVQARMGSQRLAGKVLMRLGGKPLLQYLVERLEHSCLAGHIVVATSGEASDDAIADFCRGHGVRCHRGPLANVASRFLEVLDLCRFEAFVRINGDSPLLDPRLIDQAVSIFVNREFDMVTNVRPRTYPAGQSVEVVAAAAFRRGYGRMLDPQDLEHVTKYFYNHAGDFKIFNLAAPRDYSAVHLAVDTHRDLEVVGDILARLKKPHWEYGLEEIVEIYRQVTGGPRGDGLHAAS